MNCLTGFLRAHHDSEVAHKAIVSSAAKLLAKGGNLLWSGIITNITGATGSTLTGARAPRKSLSKPRRISISWTLRPSKRHHHAMGHRYQVGPPTDSKRKPDFMKHDLDLVHA